MVDLVKKRFLLLILLFLSIISIFLNNSLIVMIILIILLIINIVYAFKMNKSNRVVNASLYWYLVTRENIMIISGIVLSFLNYYKVLTIDYLWLIINVAIIIISLINDKKTANRIY